MSDNKIPKEARNRLDALFESFSIVADDTQVFLCDMRYDYSRWSRSLVEDFGMPGEYMYAAGTLWEEFIHPDDRLAYHDGMAAIFSGTQTGHDMQYRVKRPDGEYDICTCRGIVIPDDSGNPEYFGGAIRNHSSKSQIDILTGLRNQYGFFSDIQSYITNKTPIRVGMAGIGKFANINDVYGYDIGNKVLQNFGRYLMENVTNRGGTYRLDGSRFAIISTTQDEEELAELYEILRSHMRKGIRLEGHDIIAELNAGLISLDDFNVDYQTVYSCLNYAYQDSKLNKHGDLVTFRKELTNENRKENEKLYAVHMAITRGFEGFYLLYQPVVDAGTEEIIGAEALLRWKNDEYGVVPPDVIIPFLEADPMFPELGEWILKTALDAARQVTTYVPDFVINVNLSYVQLEKANFTDIVRNTIQASGLSPKQVCLEITERCRLLDMELLRNVIIALRASGVRLALDDFGTGYSSVGLVKNLPFDTIKIDRSFVHNIEVDENERKLLGNFTDVAGTFGADVCVEGIETSGMRDIIREQRIHSFQGYYYSKPIPIEELLAKVKTGSDCFSKKE